MCSSKSMDLFIPSKAIDGLLLSAIFSASRLDRPLGVLLILATSHWTFPLPDSEFNFGERQELKNIDRTWKRKEPQRGFTLLHEFPLCAVFHCQRFRSKKIKNDNDEKSRRFFASSRYHVYLTTNFSKAATRVTDACISIRGSICLSPLVDQCYACSHSAFIGYACSQSVFIGSWHFSTAGRSHMTI